MTMAMEPWRVGGKEDVGFNTAPIYASIDEPYPGAKPRQVHVTQAEVAQKAMEEATRDPSLGPQMVQELEGHKGAATAVSFLPDGGPLVSGGADGTVRVWNSCQLKSALHNRKGFVYRGHTDAVTAVDCSPDGTLVASASKDRKVRLWHPGVDGKANAGGGVIKGHSGSVRSVNFSDDGASLLTASDDKTIKLWSLPEMRFMHALSGHTHWVRSAAFDPGHSMVVVSGGDDKTVRIWHMPRKNPVQTLFGHTGAVNAVAFHPDGFSVASASADCSVKLWDVRTGRLLQHYEPHSAAVNSLAFHPSGDYLASSSDDATVCLMDLKEGRVCSELTSLKNTSALSVTFSERGDRVAYASADGTVSLYSSNLTKPTAEAVTGLRASAPAFQPSDNAAPTASTTPRKARRPATAPSRIGRNSTSGPVTKKDLDEIKSMVNPPVSVKLVGDAVCILLGHAPSWSKFQKLLGSPSFLKDLLEFDQLSISPTTVWKLQDAELLTMPEFQPDEISKVSRAAHGLCVWVHQMAAAATGYTPTRQQRHVSRTARPSPLPSPKPQPSRPTSRSAARLEQKDRVGGARDAPLSSPVKVRGDPALFGLGMDDIRELKGLSSPPASVKIVAEAVCLLFELPPTFSQFKKLAANPSKLIRAMKAMLSPEATYPTAEAVNKTQEFVLTCGSAFSPDEVAKSARSIESVCKWVLALIGRGHGGVPMPAQVASVPPSVAPSAPMAPAPPAQPINTPAAAPAGGEGVEDLIGTTLQRMADQLDILTRTVVALDERLSSVEDAV